MGNGTHRCDVAAAGHLYPHGHAEAVLTGVRVRTRTEVDVLFLVVAFLLLVVLIGSAAYIPWPVTLVASVVIAVWLAVFAVRERRRRGRTGRA
ncbi:hypothetical protein SAV14893_074330 [Streptomyces avermitilis]|uniref:Uncharacterized protein n=1 Tax=Streptomyces avermitilis TaxID=33903 RepID=A0A4D4M7X2_STRAX|nr:hypothetical protein SAVMC3_87320 [Streptomyces avermitilis]GDY68040.1 hypothetical protein SAV14893_074330 [Streptomyces avermitilis]GDY71623.1 hypothetical protein SAV31267_011080 [Streptomyces avermitilis]